MAGVGIRHGTVAVLGSMVILFGVVAEAPGAEPAYRSHPELNLVGDMYENLSAVNRILEAVAREDFPRIGPEVSHLRKNATHLREIRLDSVGLDAARDDRFDALLTAQERIASRIGQAAESGDAAGVLVGVRALFDEACVRCHEEFREKAILREPSVLLMRNFLGAVQDMNRGLALADYALVAREARQVEAIADVFAWSQVSEALFRIQDAKDQEEFRKYLQRLSAAAVRLEGAAVSRDPSRIAEALYGMLREGCVSCHTRFRKPEPASIP